MRTSPGKSVFLANGIINILREAEVGISAGEISRKHAISHATFYIWRKKFGGIEAPEIKRHKSLEEENVRLKKLQAEAILDKDAVQDRKYGRHTRSRKQG